MQTARPAPPTRSPDTSPPTPAPSMPMTISPTARDQRSILTPTVAPTLPGSWFAEWVVEGDCFEVRRHEAQNWLECKKAYENASGKMYTGPIKVIKESDEEADSFPSRYVILGLPFAYQ